MQYEISTTKLFDTWLRSIKDKRLKARILNRIDLMESGYFGDHKSLGQGLFELRLFFGSGYRVYYSFRDQQIVLLVTAGDKSSQTKDIKKALQLIKNMK